MSISNQVIKISGEKKECLLLTESSIQFLSKPFDSIEDFNEAWNKTLTLVTKSELKYEKIKSIIKEEGEEGIVISGGMMTEYKFTFVKESDREAFYSFFQERGFIKTDEKMSIFKAVGIYVFELLMFLAATIYGYYAAMDMENGMYVEITGGDKGSRNRRFFEGIVSMLGVNGVLLIGTSICLYFCYIIWKRYKNPPSQTKLVPIS
jgi:hypothetical protein